MRAWHRGMPPVGPEMHRAQRPLSTSIAAAPPAKRVALTSVQATTPLVQHDSGLRFVFRVLEV
eukprot:scaffold102234_cov26-Prasinocladus_malaysianus.AAC.1